MYLKNLVLSGIAGLFLVALCAQPAGATPEDTAENVHAVKSVLVIDQATNRVITDDNADQIHYAASTGNMFWAATFVDLLDRTGTSLQTPVFEIVYAALDTDDPMAAYVLKKLRGKGSSQLSAAELIQLAMGNSSGNALKPMKIFVETHGQLLGLKVYGEKPADYAQAYVDSFFEEGNSSITVAGSSKAADNGQDNCGSLRDILWLYRQLDPSATSAVNNRPIMKKGLELIWKAMGENHFPDLEPKNTWGQALKTHGMQGTIAGKIGYFDNLEADWPEGWQNLNGWSTKYSSNYIWVGKLSVQVKDKTANYWYAYAYHSPHQDEIGMALVKSWAAERSQRIREFFVQVTK